MSDGPGRNCVDPHEEQIKKSDPAKEIFLLSKLFVVSAGACSGAR